MATTKLRVKRDDKLSPEELAKQNAFARDFAKRQNLITGENTHVGSSGAKFIDAATGLPMTGQPQYPSNIVMDISKVPSYVTADNIIKGKDGLSYFEDQTTGNMMPLHPDILRSPRFNPNRGKSTDMLIAKR
jgi:hypothetical protein